jgi:hypothetical protein
MTGVVVSPPLDTLLSPSTRNVPLQHIIAFVYG